MCGFADYSCGAICSPGDTHRPTPERAGDNEAVRCPNRRILRPSGTLPTLLMAAEPTSTRSTFGKRLVDQQDFVLVRRFKNRCPRVKVSPCDKQRRLPPLSFSVADPANEPTDPDNRKVAEYPYPDHECQNYRPGSDGGKKSTY
jgi:hypothetical protein